MRPETEEGTVGALATLLTAVAGLTFLSGGAEDEGETPDRKGRIWKRDRRTAVLPEDRALPGLAAIRARGLAAAMPMLGLEGRPVELTVCRYATGRRVAIEVRSGDRHFAVKAYARPPEREVELYSALAGRSLGVRVPQLLAWDRDLGLMAIEWLDGPDGATLIKDAQGRRAGELAATWIRTAAALPVAIGDRVHIEPLLAKARKWATHVAATDPALDASASAVAERLAASRPPESPPRLVHGGFYERHVIACEGGLGLIDWESVGRGPAELDAAVFLSMVWRLGLRHEQYRAESDGALEAFLEGSAGLLNARALAWHRARILLNLAHKKARRPGDEGSALMRAYLVEAARVAAEA